MRFSTLSFALGAASSAVASAIPRDDCFTTHHDDLAEYAECGSRASLAQCLAQLTSASDAAALESCYASAGCSASEAAVEARYALERCVELETYNDLRRRHSGMLRATPAAGARIAEMATMTPAPALVARENAQGNDCFTTQVHTTKICPGVVGGTSQPCHNGPVTSKSCRSGWICTEDPNGTDICMTKVDKLDIGGIIIASVFSVIIVAGVGFLIFMSCAESRAQKKMKARAEATALARAATKKKRAEEVRAPLMAQQPHQPEYQTQGGVNPFGDGQPH
ncbi:hypothetical protein PWT90_03960 [Aphanocladium album]|nr:hypothetical protein PWT90_03960 [Aphanocladium album]